MFVGKHLINPNNLCKIGINSLLWTASELKILLNNCYDLKSIKDTHIILLMDKSNLYIQSSLNFICNKLECKLNVIIDKKWPNNSKIEDVGKYLSMHSDLILCHTKKQKSIEVLAEKSQVPVLNIMSCRYKLPQALCDLMVIQSHYGHLENLTLSWVGVPCALLNTYLCILPRLKINLNYLCSCCKDRLKSPFCLQEGLTYCRESKAKIKECYKLEDVLNESDVITIGPTDQTCDVRLNLEHLNNLKKNCFILPAMPRSCYVMDVKLFEHKKCKAWKSVMYLKWIYAAMILRTLISYEHITPKPNFNISKQ